MSHSHSSSKLTISKKIAILVGLLFLFVGVSGYFLMVNHENKIIENQSVSVAEIVARQASAARSVYSNKIIGKVKKDGIGYSDRAYHQKKGALPIPAQFLKDMAFKASETSDGLYKYHAVSKWNLANDQGLDNEFLKYAWAELEKQDQAKPTQAIDWKPIYRVQEFEGQTTLVYLRADPASHDSCVSCHNEYEQTTNIINRRVEQNIDARKVWQKHQLLGAIFVRIPVESMLEVASNQSKFIILWILGILTLGLTALTVFFSRDLIKARRIRELLFWQARHDTLTRLPNRNSFESEAELLIADVASSNNTHTLFFLDLDHFKLVNDTCGHAVGDELLRDISEQLLSCLDENAFLARLGGDEFAILLRNCDVQEATLIAKNLCEIVKNYSFIRDDHSFDIGVSIGIVSIDQNTSSIEKLTRSADLACYAAKDAGKNRFHLYKNDDAIMNLKESEATWVSTIIRALEENRVAIYSQKIGAVSPDSEYTHHEILVRLIDKQGNIIPPNSFIPAAEQYRLMPKLDLAIMDRSFSALSNGYFKDLGKDGFISINLSGQSISEPEFLVNVKHLMMRYRVNPKQICFEITESAAIANQNLVKTFMTEMKRLGIKFALDDFGTGLSSLTYLKQFPVDYLKIDGSFIKDIVSDPIDRTLVDAINQMAHTMGLKTIAEYVETKEILSLLGTINIDYAQGYYIQKPTPVGVVCIGPQQIS